MFSDSHCHIHGLEAPALAETLAKANSLGVSMMVDMGESLEGSAKAAALTGPEKGVYAGVGIHPCFGVPASDDVVRWLSGLARKKGVVAIGEIGLDYVNKSPLSREEQQALFRAQLALARDLNLPVSVHSVKAHADMMGILRPEVKKGLRGVMHGFNGDTNELKDWLDLGFYIGMGIYGFLRREKPALIAAAPAIPADRLMIESDSDSAGELSGVRSPVEITADWTYVRLHGPEGPYQGSYHHDVLVEWAGQIRTWRRRLRAVYVYFDNDQEGFAPHNARELRRLVVPRAYTHSGGS